MQLNSSLGEIKGIGPKTAEALAARGFQTFKDLLYYFPRKYEDYAAYTKISEIRPGKVVVRGKIRGLRNIHTRRRNFTITQGEIFDETGALRVVWYNQAYRIKNFKEDTEYYFTGEYDFKYNRYQLTAPTAVLASEVEESRQDGGFQPIYSGSGHYNSAWYRRIFAKLRPFFYQIPELLPNEDIPKILTKLSRNQALFNMHFPESEEEVEKARTYLGYEELFELILASKLNQNEVSKLNAKSLKFNLTDVKKLLKTLPFELTDAQKRVTWQILQDLEKVHPMNRLLQGDVGSGKTIVSAIAAYQAIKNGAQVAILAPTAILATQHYEGLSKILQPLGVKTTLLISATKDKNSVKAAIKSGEIDLVIGTHAILTDDTTFSSLGLCIIDEQHRFGVLQRQHLLEKSFQNQNPDFQQISPHFLAMTATPIPRSLQLTIFGDLDISIINQMPKGRTPIKTRIYNELNLKDVIYSELSAHLAAGEQVYVICRLIDEAISDDDKSRTVLETAKLMQKQFSRYQIGILHGKLKPAEKDQVMQDFKDKKTQILVSTTVVEVGVDVPNATQIVILNADRYGLAQLHQLRGRVGRGDKPSQCFLVTTGENPPSRRLLEMEKSTDGFYLAEVDLKLRGPGEIYGAMQHGELNLKIASLTDTKMIELARTHVEKFLSSPDSMLKYTELSQDIKKYQQLTTLN